MGAYACARKWSIKAEKLEAVISALKEAEDNMISLEEAQKIYGDPQAIKRGYVTESLIQVAYEMATELKANGFTARDGMCCFPNVLHITEKYQMRLTRQELRAIDAIRAYFMG